MANLNLPLNNINFYTYEVDVNSGWNINELQAAVEAYIDMLNKEQCGKPFIKKNYYKELARKFGRGMRHSRVNAGSRRDFA